MFEEYIKTLNERKKINKKIYKSYNKIIISIIVILLHYVLPIFTSGILFEWELFIRIVAVFLGMGGAAFNFIKVLFQKNKLRDIQYEEKEKLLEIKSQIESLTHEKQLTNSEIKEIHKSTKAVLKEIKNDIKKRKESLKNNEKTINQENNHQLTDEEIELEENITKTK